MRLSGNDASLPQQMDHARQRLFSLSKPVGKLGGFRCRLGGQYTPCLLIGDGSLSWAGDVPSCQPGVACCPAGRCLPARWAPSGCFQAPSPSMIQSAVTRDRSI